MMMTISSLNDGARNMLSLSLDMQDEMAFPVGINHVKILGISLLSQIIRLSPPKDMAQLDTSLLDVLQHLYQHKRWYALKLRQGTWEKVYPCYFNLRNETH